MDKLMKVKHGFIDRSWSSGDLPYLLLSPPLCTNLSKPFAQGVGG